METPACQIKNQPAIPACQASVQLSLSPSSPLPSSSSSSPQFPRCPLTWLPPQFEWNHQRPIGWPLGPCDPAQGLKLRPHPLRAEQDFPMGAACSAGAEAHTVWASGKSLPPTPSFVPPVPPIPFLSLHYPPFSFLSLFFPPPPVLWNTVSHSDSLCCHGELHSFTGTDPQSVNAGGVVKKKKKKRTRDWVKIRSKYPTVREE